MYEDSDGDGFGNPAVALDACDAPAGWVLDATDCDDTLDTCAADCDTKADGDAFVACNDCDDQSGAVGEPPTWYLDADGDGFGVTDRVDEAEALLGLVRETGVRMIQWRNLNVDPDWYVDVLGSDTCSPRLGMRALLERVRSQRPELRFGYFNPPAEDWNDRR